ncbi:MAG: hypothetical protein ACI8WB_002501 [Phenylobacterium sp.]|jgi:hypothetical protein
MATLRNLHNGEKTNLLSLHIIGRHPGPYNIVLDNPQASRTHATITWDGESWLLQDTSTNGTYVNGLPMVSKVIQALKPGDMLNFSTPDDNTWQVDDVEPPKSMLMPQTPGSPLIVLDNIAVLPSEESPEITLYQTPDGHWMCESESSTVTLVNGHKVDTNDDTWCFIEAAGSIETLRVNAQAAITLSDVSVNFNASQNEEHVSLALAMNQQRFDLGERNHHYLLLVLARQYIEDAQAGFAIKEQGWIEKEQLAKMLRLTEPHINMLIYRFRKQVLKTMPENMLLPQMVERRKGALRFVCENVRIEGGMQF